ncbi:Hypothetical protein NTJ_08394 [Nesidiocoris tenuis]|uniref:CUB domain-containing protein n=1 Tax=Nesidiocoris tenuis TaxID=355587 RepID=A0ABN7AVM2_9HEMI|nr:Hypothetical protein NTJ_08394 [Nesidiocoris tenuis]
MLPGVLLLTSGALLLVAAPKATTPAVGGSSDQCGGLLSAEAGVITTPNFPGLFPVPITCQWIIDSSAMPEGTLIIVYLTQLFVTTGLSFTEYTYYEPGSSFKLNPRLIHQVTEDNVITKKWVYTRTHYLVIELTLSHVEGNHLRVLDELLDVFGFNITYVMNRPSQSPNDELPVPQNDSCSVLECSLAGHCFVNLDFT